MEQPAHASDMRIEDIPYWTTRTLRVMQNEGIITLGDLAHKTEQEMMRAPNCGRRTMAEMRETLSMFGLTFTDPTAVRFENEYSRVAHEFNKQQRAYVAAFYTLTAKIDVLMGKVDSILHRLGQMEARR